MPPKAQTPRPVTPVEKDRLFILKNYALIAKSNLYTGNEKHVEGIVAVNETKSNVTPAISAMKVAFEPMGQHTLRKDEENKKWERERADMITDPSKWPGMVPSFELWAAATSYDPTKPNGGLEFQNMMKFLLVDTNNEPQFNGDDYFVKGQGRGPGWYKQKKEATFEGTPHSLRLKEEYASYGAWHTPESQGAVNNAGNNDRSKSKKPNHITRTPKCTGGRNGAISGVADGYYMNHTKLQKMQKTVTINPAYEVGSKLNWLKHCMCILQGKHDDDAGGNHNSSTQFLSHGELDNCNEYQKGCMAGGNTYAALIGLYYYPECDEAANNWVVEQTRGEYTYPIRMRMWNPRYSLVTQDATPMLLVREPVNNAWAAALKKTGAEIAQSKSDKYVGSHIVNNTAKAGFYLPHIYKSTNQLGGTMRDKATPPQPLKNLVQWSESKKTYVSSLAPFFGIPGQPDKHGNPRGGQTEFAITTSVFGNEYSLVKDFRELMILLKKHLGDVAQGPSDLKDDIGFGFRVPKAHWLYPHWGDKHSVKLKHALKGKQKHMKQGTGFQPNPTWHPKRAYLTDTGPYKLKRMNELTEGRSEDALVKDIESFGLAISLLDIDYRESGTVMPKLRLPQMNSIEYALEESEYTAYYDEEEAPAARSGKAPAASGKEPEAAQNPNPNRASRSRTAPGSSATHAGLPSLEEEEEVEGAAEEDDGDETADSYVRQLDHDIADEEESTTDANVSLPDDDTQESFQVLTEAEMLGRGLGVEDAGVEDPGELVKHLRKESKKGEREGGLGLKESQRDLLPGAIKRVGRDLNAHFSSSNLQAWAHHDIYKSENMEITSEVLDPEALKTFTDDYGSSANAYLRGELMPQRITGIKQVYGEALPVINSNLCAKTPLHRKNMCRILAIYNEEGEFGNKYSNFQLSNDEKKNGMQFGVYGKTDSYEIRYGWPRGKAYGFPPPTLPKGWQCLWPPVFGKKSNGKANVPESVSMETVRLRGTADETRDAWDMKTANMKAGADADVCRSDYYNMWFKSCNTKMTVLSWITSPWHYLSLPYQKKRILFEDSETYSEGCKRCSRPFYEYKYMYSWFLRGPQRTAHFPNSYWCVSLPNSASCNTALAPKPFHEDIFWEVPTGNAVTVLDKETVLHEREEDGSGKSAGWHNWPLRAFKFGHIPGTQQVYPELKAEYMTRNGAQRRINGRMQHTLSSDVNTLPANNKPLLYKRYTNHAYREHSPVFQGEYPMYPQSRPSTNAAKIKVGMRDYCLQRASKYGNICHDCAIELELAPGLLVRNYRKQTFKVGNFHGKMAKDDEGRGEHANTYWTQLLSTYRKAAERGDLAADYLAVDNMVNYDLEIIHGKHYDPAVDGDNPERVRSFNDPRAVDASMRAYAELISMQQNLHLGSDKNGKPITKYNSPPDIYIQKELELKSGIFGEVDHVQIKAAVKALVAMRAKTVKTTDAFGNVTDVSVEMSSFWTDTTPAGVAEREKVFAMPALHHMIFELERKYMHHSEFTRDKQTKVFDSDMVRVEYRNQSMELDGQKYANCLVVKQYVPPKVQKGRNGEIVHPQPAAKTIYYYDKKREEQSAGTGTPAKKTVNETMWLGDEHVMQGRGQEVQYRKMRQSRLFITYSLHRATTSENEARFLMMRMADAAHELFGNDQNLSELLVFGHKLAAGAKGKNDSLSQGGFELIKAPNKKDQIANFYGDATGSSYIYDTYQTHVDKVDLDGGIEIGPQRHHPHFHMLLTINHWSYIQIDYFKMNAYLEMMFKGIDPLLKGWGERFQLLDSSGNLFYTDNENPYVDIKLYPQDNWNDIISAYVRKNAVPGPIEAQRVARDAI